MALRSSTRSPLGRLWGYAKEQRGLAAWSATCSVLNKLFDIAPEILIGMAVDVVVNRQASLLARWGISSLEQQLLWLGAATFVIWFLESLFEYLFSVGWRNLAQRIQHQLRLDAYQHLQKLPRPEVEARPAGSVLSLLNDDINQLERFLDGGANSLIQVVTSVLLVGLTFFYLSPTVAVLAFLPIPVILLGGFAFQRRLQPRYAEVRARSAEVNSRLLLNLQGLLQIQAYGGEEFEAERVEQASLAYQAANRSAIALSSAFTPVLRMAILAGFLCTLIVGGKQCLAGQLSAGSYSVLVFLTQRLLWPLTGLASTLDLYERAMASANRVLDLLEIPAVDLEQGQEVAQVKGDLRFQQVSFAYPNGAKVLDQLDLTIAAGQTTAVVGPTGSGKSTLVKLLLRFLEPSQGLISLDGIPLSELSRCSLRQCFALVAQDVHLSDDSVLSNVAYAQTAPDEGRVESTLELAEAKEFVQSLPGGVRASLGERAQQLSGGQRQRLAIARALYRGAPILLLDEATSALDNVTEAALVRSLERISQGRTTLVIAHRLSTVVHADIIHVLDKGKIVESGTHQELLNSDGLYAQLWRIQTASTT
jgi:ATP-binding cassette subfamily B protein